MGGGGGEGGLFIQGRRSEENGNDGENVTQLVGAQWNT